MMAANSANMLRTHFERGNFMAYELCPNIKNIRKYINIKTKLRYQILGK